MQENGDEEEEDFLDDPEVSDEILNSKEDEDGFIDWDLLLDDLSMITSSSLDILESVDIAKEIKELEDLLAEIDML